MKNIKFKINFTISLLIFSVMLISFGAGAENEEKKVEENVKAYLGGFFREVIIKRDRPSSGAWFCEEGEFTALEDDEKSPQYAKSINYDNQKLLFIEDCKSLMDMLPKHNTDFIKLVNVEKVKIGCSGIVGGEVYKAYFSYGEGSSIFSIVFPTLIDGKAGKKFASRFWIPIRMVR